MSRVREVALQDFLQAPSFCFMTSVQETVLDPSQGQGQPRQLPGPGVPLAGRTKRGRQRVTLDPDRVQDLLPLDTLPRDASLVSDLLRLRFVLSWVVVVSV